MFFAPFCCVAIVSLNAAATAVIGTGHTAPFGWAFLYSCDYVVYGALIYLLHVGTLLTALIRLSINLDCLLPMCNKNKANDVAAAAR